MNQAAINPRFNSLLLYFIVVLLRSISPAPPLLNFSVKSVLEVPLNRTTIYTLDQTVATGLDEGTFSRLFFLGFVGITVLGQVL